MVVVGAELVIGVVSVVVVMAVVAVVAGRRDSENVGPGRVAVVEE